MLWNIFKIISEMSVTASITAFVLILLKFILHKLSFPRRYLMLFWIIILLRLVFPCTIQSDFSLLNIFNDQTKQAVTVAKIENSKIHISLAEVPSDDVWQIVSSQIPPKDTINRNIVLAIWIFGILTMNTYRIIKTCQLKKYLRYSIKTTDNIYEADNIHTSFVVGFFIPLIYIPAMLPDTDKQNMIVHEQTHIRYMHNIIKIISYIILSVHWFNPAVWLVYHILCADMEYVCDEICVDNVHKKAYMTTLLNAGCAAATKTVPPYLCSFSSLSKKRIASLAKYKKHSKLYVLPSVALCIALMLVLCTSAKERADIIKSDLAMPYSSLYALEKQESERTDSVIYSPPAEKEKKTENLTTQIENKEKDENISKKRLSNYKSSEKSDIPYGGVHHLEPDGIDTDSLCFELENNNLINNSVNADLKKNYIKASYSSTPDAVTIPSVSCDENGNISLYISLNGDSLFEVTVYESQTRDIVHSCMVLANGKNAFSLLGFEMDKKYDISLKEATNGQWKTEGYYIIY